MGKLLKGWNRKEWVSLVPYGLNQQHPNGYRDILEAIWENRDNLGYAWRILRDGCCDGCALAPRVCATGPCAASICARCGCGCCALTPCRRWIGACLKTSGRCSVSANAICDGWDGWPCRWCGIAATGDSNASLGTKLSL